MDIAVYGMSCERCETKISAALEVVPGVKAVRIDRQRDLVQVEGNASRTAIEQAIVAAGYRLERTSDEADSRQSTSSQHIALLIEGMSCASCVRSVESALLNVPGVSAASVNYAAGRANVHGDVKVEALLHAVSKAGYGASEPDAAREANKAKMLQQRLVLNGLQAGLALLAGAALMFQGEWLMTRLGGVLVAIIVLVILLLTGRRYYQGALASLRQGRATMDSLIALGTGSAWLYSMLVLLAPHYLEAAARHVFFEAALFIIGFVHLGKSIEEFARGGTSLALSRLLDLRPRFAVRLQDGFEQEIAIDLVQPGDELLVRAGQAVPVDGELTQGTSTLDEQMISGEAEPVVKNPGDQLLAGTVNLDGAITLRASAVGSDTVLGRMAEAVQQAQDSKPPIANLADQISAWFVPAVILFAILAATAWWVAGQGVGMAVTVFMTVLVVACPCALGLAIPMSIMVGVGRAAELGLLVKNGAALQAASYVDTLVLDKTGTLTLGQPEVTAVQVCPGADEEMLKAIAVTLEAVSIHPLAMAIVKTFTGTEALPIEDIKTEPGAGIRGVWQGQPCLIGSEAFLLEEGYPPFPYNPPTGSLMFVGHAGRWLGVIAAQDALRTEAATTLLALKQQGIEPVLMSGDRSEVVAAVAQQLNIQRYFAEMTPQQKQAEIQALQTAGARVAMVGDGINDALALSQADVGIAMGTGSDVAIESADMTLLGDDLGKLPLAFNLARRVISNVKQNLGAAFIYNLCLLPVAAGVLYPATGTLLNPALAGLAMALSSISVVANALRLKLVA